MLHYGQPRFQNVMRRMAMSNDFCESEPGNTIFQKPLNVSNLQTKIMVNYWLAKQEPSGPRGYNFEQLKKDKTTCLLYTSPSPRDRG